VEVLLQRFQAAHTQVLGVSVDSIHCHANWARALGGVSFPLLSDFEPKGAVAREYGLYLDGPGLTDRASVWIDAGGVVRSASSAGPGGERNIEELAAQAERLDAEFSGTRVPFQKAPGAAGAILYVRDNCGFSRAVRVAIDNLHLHGVEIRNVSRDEDALRALREISDAETAPCLVLDAEVVGESSAIISLLADRASPMR
jgi:glutaredoxin-related protein